ncbi:MULTISPECIES: hypothetical protein [unclassified Duganella]|uniref:hypothetical protein n=1 Tax=unclassified Duganella TaxID=2636909 RepID=UPI0006FD7419|nr:MULTISPECIES: hypothetical protein [unclassified Duganella]KQV46082.1 hypothetical protein ASD07_16510 [Duganella sp. Root336D2]KRB81748.1 hypothetical protein ASE26_15555 [Duganella sp. Root198D2]
MAQGKQLSNQNRQSVQTVESDQTGNKDTAKRNTRNEASRTKAGSSEGAGGGAKQKAKRG